MASPTPSRDLAARVLRGDTRAIARAMTVVERGGATAEALLETLYPHGGRALVVGITGAPGSGKSTLADRLVSVVRRSARRVGVVAIDPSSPFSGGAVLGDRVRMAGHAGDAGVFIRSMATRGHLGGLAAATADVVSVLDAAGFEVVLVETVGVGQDEVDVMRLAHITALVLVPGAGDDVQALKAGVMEIADVFVVNKADRPDADRVVSAVEAMLALRPAEVGVWVPPVLKAQAVGDIGVDAVWDAVERGAAHEGRRGADAHGQAGAFVREAIGRVANAAVASLGTAACEPVLADVRDRRMTPTAAARQLLRRAFGPTTGARS